MTTLTDKTNKTNKTNTQLSGGHAGLLLLASAAAATGGHTYHKRWSDSGSYRKRWRSVENVK